MRAVPASHCKQNFGEVLALAAREPVAIERHRRVVAGLVPPEWLQRADPLQERRAARDRQQLVELQRLMKHQRAAIELLSATPDAQLRRLEAARAEVDRWESGQLCSPEYIERWRKWLKLPPPELVKRMCSDADGWGPAMRQNSPFLLSGA